MTNEREFFEERAAIREYDGGSGRDEAEAMALGDVALRYGWPAVVGLVQGENDGEASQR